MTNEQCIEVATKLWGWAWHPEGEIPSGNQWEWQGRWTDGYGSVVLYQRDVSDKVKSWSGFGRTVEAMADEYGSLQVFGGWVSFNRDREVSDSFGLIEATHRAALEALK